jgi:hypothetical protein|tara:strand:+ start:935 stop:1210 length:276 start_codon:yes stop_codon:yes gene_type:complete
MSQVRTLLVGTGSEVALDTATNLSNATVIRVINLSGADATVSVAKSTTTGYASTATVTLPDDRVEFFEKGPNDIISASSSNVKGMKVGFTG